MRRRRAASSGSRCRWRASSRPLGIRVVTIAPGIFDTPLLGGAAGTGARLARSAGAVPVAAGPARRIRRAGAAHHRERDAEWRSHPPGRCSADGAHDRYSKSTKLRSLRVLRARPSVFLRVYALSSSRAAATRCFASLAATETSTLGQFGLAPALAAELATSALRSAGVDAGAGAASDDDQCGRCGTEQDDGGAGCSVAAAAAMALNARRPIASSDSTTSNRRPYARPRHQRGRLVDGELLLQRPQRRCSDLLSPCSRSTRRRQLLGRHRQVTLRGRQGIAPELEAAQRPVAAEELDTRAAAELLPPG